MTLPHLRPLAALLLSIAMVSAACGGGGDGPGDSTPGGGSPTADTSSSPVLAMPVSRFSLSLDDLPNGYLTDRTSTFNLDATNYGATRTFPNAEEGRKLLEQWGYLGGYETAFEPDKRMAAVLDGAYYAAVEVHLFRNSTSATDAQHYFEQRLSAASDRVTASTVGNESSAWKVTQGTIPGSNVPAAYHRIIFRRGNMVAVVQTFGSEVLMNIDRVRELATLVDQKALGGRAAVVPTPLGQPQAATPTP